MLKFIYGVMGSSKTAQALINNFDYQQNGFQTILMKPSIDNRDPNIRSRIGLNADCLLFTRRDNLKQKCFFNIKNSKVIIIVDECQFCTKAQIEQLKEVSRLFDVFCYGLKVNVESNLFEGSKRLIELADELQCIDNVCSCGKKAILNLLFDKKGNIIKKDKDIKDLKGLTHKSVCYDCWKRYMD